MKNTAWIQFAAYFIMKLLEILTTMKMKDNKKYDRYIYKIVKDFVRPSLVLQFVWQNPASKNKYVIE